MFLIILYAPFYHHKISGKTIQEPSLDFKCKYGDLDCCKPFELTEEPKDYSAFKFVANRNAQDNFLECGFNKEGKYSGVFEGFPDVSQLCNPAPFTYILYVLAICFRLSFSSLQPTTMYAKLAEKKISVLALVASKTLPNEAYDKWIKSYTPLATKAGAKLHVADWHNQKVSGVVEGLESLMKTHCAETTVL